MEDQPMYYENKFSGEWKCEIEDDRIRTRLVAFIGFTILMLIISGVIAMSNTTTEFKGSVVKPLFVALILNFILLYIPVDW